MINYYEGYNIYSLMLRLYNLKWEYIVKINLIIINIKKS